MKNGTRCGPSRHPIPAVEKILFDFPVSNSERLLFAIKRALDPLLGKLASQYRALTALHIHFVLDRAEAPERRDVIKPAEPTLDARTLLRLVHLRLESSPPKGGVNEIELSVEDTPATREQLALFARKPRRDLDAANEALARLRARAGQRRGHEGSGPRGSSARGAVQLGASRAGFHARTHAARAR